VIEQCVISIGWLIEKGYQLDSVPVAIGWSPNEDIVCVEENGKIQYYHLLGSKLNHVVPVKIEREKMTSFPISYGF
jgi:hypothetical protein